MNVTLFLSTGQSGTLSEYFDLMKRKFTPNEWRTIKSAGTNHQQLEMYYRHWVMHHSKDFLSVFSTDFQEEDGISHEVKHIH